MRQQISNIFFLCFYRKLDLRFHLSEMSNLNFYEKLLKTENSDNNTQTIQFLISWKIKFKDTH